MTQDRDRKQAAREMASALGVSYSVAARKLADPPRAEAAATREERCWRVVTPETARRGGSTLSWRVAVPWDDRDTFIEQAARELEGCGWAADAWPAEITPVMTIPLTRSFSGHLADEAARLHTAAGVSYHRAHHAYVAAVAATVEAAGIAVGDVDSDCDEPRGGGFRIGGDLEDLWDDDEGYGPSTVVQWREDRGWYHVFFSDSQAALGDYAADLPGGSLPLVATPEQVAAAVLQLLTEDRQDGTGTAPAIPAWQMPDGYEADPPAAEDEGWEVSPRLERSLTAYVGLRPPAGLPAWLTRA